MSGWQRVGKRKLEVTNSRSKEWRRVESRGWGDGSDEYGSADVLEEY